MSVDSLPIWLEFIITILLVLVALEMGYRIGRAMRRRREGEKESAVSAIAGVILSLTSFLLAFTFGIVNARHDARESLVRDEATELRLAWQRAELLPEHDRREAKQLLREYVDLSLTLAQSHDSSPQFVNRFLSEGQRVQDRLWSMAIANAHKDMNPGFATAYMGSLGEVTRLHASRVAVGVRSRVSNAIWIALYCIATLGMASVGYQTGISGSRRSLIWSTLAVAFALVFTLIITLDRPVSEIMKVNQRPLLELQDAMSATPNR